MSDDLLANAATRREQTTREAASAMLAALIAARPLLAKAARPFNREHDAVDQIDAAITSARAAGIKVTS